MNVVAFMPSAAGFDDEEVGRLYGRCACHKWCRRSSGWRWRVNMAVAGTATITPLPRACRVSPPHQYKNSLTHLTAFRYRAAGRGHLIARAHESASKTWYR